MANRKKKGIAAFISGALFIVVGFAFYTQSVTPEWVSTGIALVGLVAETLGFKIVYPDTEE